MNLKHRKILAHKYPVCSFITTSYTFIPNCSVNVLCQHHYRVSTQALWFIEVSKHLIVLSSHEQLIQRKENIVMCSCIFCANSVNFYA